MKRFFLSILLGVGAIQSGAMGAPADVTNASPYTIGQLTNLIQAKIDPDLFASQMVEWGVKLDVATVINLHSNGVSEADLQYMEQVINSTMASPELTQEIKSAPAPATNSPSQPAVSGAYSNAQYETSSNLGSQTSSDTNITRLATLFIGNYSNDIILADMSEHGIKLDAATIYALDKAGVGLAELQPFEQYIDSQMASVKLAAVTNLELSAVTNLSLAATNVPMARTNLSLVAEYVSRMVASLSAVQTNSADTQSFTRVTNNLDDIATGLEDYATNLVVQANIVSRPYQAFITSGAEFLNPYAVSVVSPTPYGKGVLTNAGNSTVGFVEFDYINRHVLRSEPRDMTKSTNWWSPNFGGQWVNPFKKAPDVQFAMGFLFDNGTTISNQSYSAQTLAGADFYAQLTLGFPLWQLDLTNQSHQVSLEASGGVATDKNFEEEHPNAFVGLGYETSFRPFLQSTMTNTCGFFEAKAGAGWVDVPSMVGTNNLVNLDGNGNPIFNFRPACELGAYLAYPLTSKIYLTVDATDYLGYRPPQSWNIKVGASIPLDSISSVFSSLITSIGGNN